jgi:hypothetical protein
MPRLPYGCYRTLLLQNSRVKTVTSTTHQKLMSKWLAPPQHHGWCRTSPGKTPVADVSWILYWQGHESPTRTVMVASSSQHCVHVTSRRGFMKGVPANITGKKQSHITSDRSTCQRVQATSRFTQGAPAGSQTDGGMLHNKLQIAHSDGRLFVPALRPCDITRWVIKRGACRHFHQRQYVE